MNYLYLGIANGKQDEAFLKENFPKSLAEITNEWLSNLVRGDVTSFESQILEDGVMADAAIIRPVYGAEKGPSSIVLKYVKGTEAGIAAGKSLNAYEKEIKFYATLRDKVHPFMPCSKIIGLFSDPDKPENFCIAMEDLNIENNAMSIPVGLNKE